MDPDHVDHFHDYFNSAETDKIEPCSEWTWQDDYNETEEVRLVN